jgi:hypothetical protein
MTIFYSGRGRIVAFRTAFSVSVNLEKIGAAASRTLNVSLTAVLGNVDRFIRAHSRPTEQALGDDGVPPVQFPLR